MYDPFLRGIEILHTEALWVMLYNIKESCEMLEKQSLAQDKSKDYKNFYKSLKSLNECRWKVLMLSREIEGRVLSEK